MLVSTLMQERCHDYPSQMAAHPSSFDTAAVGVAAAGAQLRLWPVRSGGCAGYSDPFVNPPLLGCSATDQQAYDAAAFWPAGIGRYRHRQL